MPKNIFAIKDTHTDSAGRNRAKEILESGGINCFFIEWPLPINKNDLETSFIGLAVNDAHPNLKELTKIAIDKGIDVIPCDLTADETLKRLDALNDGYGPYSILSVFQAWGKEIRDENAAQIIARYIKESQNGNCRGLVMFGADHFVMEKNRKKQPLHKLIHEMSNVDCFIVSNDKHNVDFPRENTEARI
jgi:hypothetical protein